MKYRKLDANGDYVIGTGADFLVNTPAAVAQSVQTRLALFTGEWFLDTSDGTPWRTSVLGKYTRDTFDTVIRQRILATPGVLGITAYSSLFDTAKRILNVNATLATIYGTTQLQGTL